MVLLNYYFSFVDDINVVFGLVHEVILKATAFGIPLLWWDIKTVICFEFLCNKRLLMGKLLKLIIERTKTKKKQLTLILPSIEHCLKIAEFQN